MENNKQNYFCPIKINESLKNRNSITFDVPGEPFAKQRPRAAKKGRYITIYTPPETKLYEKKVKESYQKIYKDKQLKGDLSVYIEGIFPVPKSISNKKREKILKEQIPHIKKPDCDNMAKVCLDALNGLAYPDDAQINILNISKRYGRTPRVEIAIIENTELDKNEE